MQIDLSGKTAIVSGSTAGIGMAIATGLAAAGAAVVVNGRGEATVEKALDGIRKAVPSATVSGFAADLGDAAGCEALVKAHPACDILVNNLGIYSTTDFFDTPDSEWTRHFEVNVMSGIRLSRAYLPGMLRQRWGRVIFISSESALNIPSDMIHYGMTKTAQLAIARGLAKRMAGTGVTVNSVLPGPTLTEGMAAMLGDTIKKTGQTVDQAATDFVMAKRPSSIIRRAATVEEVANMWSTSPRPSLRRPPARRCASTVASSIRSPDRLRGWTGRSSSRRMARLMRSSTTARGRWRA